MSAETLLLGAMGIGTTMQVAGQLQEGKEAEQQGRDIQRLAQARAEIDLANAEAVQKQSAEKARILKEESIRAKAKILSSFAAGNISLKSNSPLVAAAQDEADRYKDIGYVLEGGRTEAGALRSEAAFETAYGEQMLKKGKAARKQSLWGAIGTGIQGYGSMAYMGYEGGLWGNKKTKAPVSKKTASSSITSKRGLRLDEPFFRF